MKSICFIFKEINLFFNYKSGTSIVLLKLYLSNFFGLFQFTSRNKVIKLKITKYHLYALCVRFINSIFIIH
jgi:hypothetical protein